jgi:ABC-type amino acid transport substrate-binding protein
MKGTAMAEAAVAAGVPPRNLDDGIAPGAYGEALHAGQITAGVWSVDRAIPAQREDPNLEFGMFLGRPGSLAFAVRKEDSQLLGAINDQITSVRRSGSWSQLVVKYFGENALGLLKVARTE